jgi:hypothetical protein
MSRKLGLVLMFALAVAIAFGKVHALGFSSGF